MLMVKPTATLSGKKAREVIYKGVNAIYDPVKSTLGPEGKNVLLYAKYGGNSRITNDGVSVAEAQEPKNQFVRLAAQTFKEACKKTNEKVGDGTTTTAVIGGKLFNEIMKSLTETQTDLVANTTPKNSVQKIKREILETAKKVKEQVEKQSKKVKTLEELEHIATISVEDVELGKIIAKMAWEVGVDGFIDVVEGYKDRIETEIIKGTRFPAKVAHKAFVNKKETYEMIIQDCPVLLTNYKLDNTGDFAKAFQELNTKTSKIAVLAPDFSENVLENFAQAIKQGFYLYPVKVPSLRTEQFEDLAIYFDAVFIDKQQGKRLNSVSFNDLGFVEKLIVKDSEAKEDAVAIGGRGALNIPKDKKGTGFDEKEKETKLSPVEERINTLKEQIKETRQEQFKKLLQRRIAAMASAVGTIRVGDTTNASSYYRKLKIEDAVYACKSALKGGYVKGGGLALKEIADKLSDKNILKTALLAPYEQIKSTFGDDYTISDDVIDPAEAVMYAVEHATGVVSNLITVDTITVELEQPQPEEGNFAIAKMMRELVINDKIHKGLIKDGEKEAWRDSMGGMTEDEFLKSEDWNN